MSAEVQGRQAAHEFRETHHLGTQPLGDLVAIIELATGVDVAVLEAPALEHGLTMHDPASDAIFIGVARTHNPMRQRSTLAHELAHVLFQDWTNADEGSLGERRPAEIRADAFARHLLVPVEGIREFLGDRSEVATPLLSEVVQRFLVSPALAAIALHQAGYIAEGIKTQWMGLSAPDLAARFGWSDQYLALQAESHQRRAPQRLLARAIRGYEAGVVSTQALATLRGIPVAEIETELQQAGIEPPDASVHWSGPDDLPEIDLDLSDLDDDAGVVSAPNESAASQDSGG